MISIVGDQLEFVALDLEVVAIAERAQGSLSGCRTYFVVISDDALAVARAIKDDSIEVVRSTGAGVPPAGWPEKVLAKIDH